MPQSIREYLTKGPATSKEIQAATGQSQAAVSRKLRQMGDNVIKLQQGRSPRYALTRNAFGGGDRLSLGMVDAYGNTDLAAYVRPLAHGGFFVESATGTPEVLLGENGDGLYSDLPYFLLDLAPQGFLGRKIAQELSSQSEDFPSDPRHWNGNHIGRYLISNGDDLPGNFKFGQQALDRVRRKLEIVSDEEYPQLADDVMSGVIPGSSAGGEQPKFTAFSAHRSAHVIVKFAPRGDNAIARRWRDILITEHHATEALHKYEIPAAETRLLEVDGMLFLESERFDRSSQHGRLPMVSLQAVDAEFVGMGSNWLRVLTELHKKKLVNDEPVYDAELYWRFGRCINNSDMHLGNISLAIAGDVFKLLPIYDMCSMGFAPKSGGEIPPLDFIPTETNWGFCEGAKCIELHKLAHNFWDNVANDPRISDEFKAYLELGNPIDRMQQG